MTGFILGEKGEQKQFFTERGERIPTTFIKTSPNYLLAVKEANNCLQIKLGFGITKNIKKPVAGELKKAGVKTSLRFLREFRLSKKSPITLVQEGEKNGLQIGEQKILVGDLINPSFLFKKGDKVKITGISKGKGFQGVVKRHGFRGGPRTHGQSHGERAPGSIGMTTTPGRVFKGKRMAGRMGNATVSIRNLVVVEVNEQGILVKGLIPGPKSGLIKVIGLTS